MTPGRTRILFVCIGNSCRSQMAEGFARAYGADVVVAASAGLAPATSIARDTLRAMDEKNIDLRDHFPKTIRHLGRAQFDIVINISGHLLPADTAPKMIDWDIPDPIRVSYERHCAVRDEIERRVMKIVLDLRRDGQTSKMRGQGSGPAVSD